MSLKKSRKCLIGAFLVTLCFSCANDTKKITKNGMVNDDEEIRSLLKKTEIIVELENGFICTTTSCPEYKLFDNGNYIKTGIKTIIDYKNKSNENKHYETIVREVYSDIKVNQGSGLEFQAIK